MATNGKPRAGGVSSMSFPYYRLAVLEALAGLEFEEALKVVLR
jgi:hypothetical protein